MGADRLVLYPEDVGMHYLRYDGYMYTHIAGVPDRNLMAIGRWRSLGFMVYIQHQISYVSTSVSVCMR